MQPRYDELNKAAAPLVHAGIRHLQLFGNLLLLHSIRAEQLDPLPLNQTGGQRTRIGQLFQLLSVRRAYNQLRFRSSHRHRHFHRAPETPALRVRLMTLAFQITDRLLELQFAATNIGALSAPRLAMEELTMRRALTVAPWYSSNVMIAWN